jgi:hypothetical protein
LNLVKNIIYQNFSFTPKYNPNLPITVGKEVLIVPIAMNDDNIGIGMQQ